MAEEIHSIKMPREMPGESAAARHLAPWPPSGLGLCHPQSLAQCAPRRLEVRGYDTTVDGWRSRWQRRPAALCLVAALSLRLPPGWLMMP